MKTQAVYSSRFQQTPGKLQKNSSRRQQISADSSKLRPTPFKTFDSSRLQDYSSRPAEDSKLPQTQAVMAKVHVLDSQKKPCR